ncbi:hypothetical protein CYMTET_26445 [Cymbomonas tetramitiformis]|uniref:Uncharacterized protein n=1 Tax=Cymbomonas tetramitiformis TaxID=36881 RepID=A0AAE0FS88_9CHLO|nr:hypothetical protein CYMTET_26445 [Cymbomonas tetramitiformis]
MKRKGNNQSILKTCRGRKPQQSDYRDLAEVKLAETEVGKVEMDLAEVGKVEVDLADLGKVEVGKVEVDLAEVDLAEVGKVEVGKVEVDLAEVVKKYPCKVNSPGDSRHWSSARSRNSRHSCHACTALPVIGSNLSTPSNLFAIQPPPHPLSMRVAESYGCKCTQFKLSFWEPVVRNMFIVNKA